MATTNRPALIKKTHRVLKQHYKPVPAESRPLLEQLLFACCLENAPYPAAEKAYQHLRGAFFDWNEIRVSTVTELAEQLHGLPNPAATAANLKRVLQGVFETTYSFDLEPLKKQNIGVGIKKLEKLHGGSASFVIAYATQTALSGHSIPLDRAALETLYVVGIATEKEVHSGTVSGLERTIPKNKGVEFGSLLHQLAAEFHANHNSPNARKILTSIAADAKDRFPKRGVKFLAPPQPEKKPVKAAIPVPAAKRPAPLPPGKKAPPPDKKRPAAKVEHKAAPARKPTKRPTKQLAKRKPR
jgi:endonuclease-3